MSNFSKGKWEINNKHLDISCNGKYVALVCTFPPYYKDASCKKYFYDEQSSVYTEEARANARLIASAPEMYELLNYFCLCVCDIERGLSRLKGLCDKSLLLLARIDGEEVEHE